MKRLLFWLAALELLAPLHAQVVGSPIATAAAFQFFDNSGIVMTGGKICTYAAGTSTPLAAYTDSSLTVPQTNPVVLDSSGRPQGGGIYIGTIQYKFVARLGGDGTCTTGVVIWTQDHVTNGSTLVNTFAGTISIVGTPSQITVTNLSNNITLSIPSTLVTGLFQANNAGAALCFDSPNLHIDCNGNLSTSVGAGTGGNLLIGGGIDTLVWYGMKPEASTPVSTPGGGHAALTYKGGATGTQMWLYDSTVAHAWVTVDFGGGGGGGGGQTIIGTANQITASTIGTVTTLSLPTRVDTNEFNALGAGAAIVFNSANFLVDGNGNVTTANGGGAGNINAAGYVDTAIWYGMKPSSGTPGTTPGGGYSALTYKGGTSGLHIWLYDAIHAAWSDIDLGAVAGGLTSLNGQTGAAQTIAVGTSLNLVTTTNTQTLNAIQDIRTSAGPTFATVTATGANSFVSTDATGTDQAFVANGGTFIVTANGNINSATFANTNGYKIGGVYVIDASKNAVVNNLTVGGTCTGCASAGVTSLTGTANQVFVNSGLGPISGAITLSLPQSIGTGSSPTFANVTVSGVFNSTATGTNFAFEGNGGTFLVNGNGDISGAGSLNMAAGTGLGAVRVGGTVVIDGSRNTTVNNLTIQGTCTGCSGSGVTSITGTANEVLASVSTGAVTLSTPQPIATTSSVTFSSVVANGAFNSTVTGAANGLIINGGTVTINGAGTIGAQLVNTNGYQIGAVTVVDSSRNFSGVSLTLSGITTNSGGQLVCVTAGGLLYKTATTC